MMRDRRCVLPRGGHGSGSAIFSPTLTRPDPNETGRVLPSQDPNPFACQAPRPEPDPPRGSRVTRGSTVAN